MDVRLYQKNGDGGEIDWIGGQAVVDAGLETAVYLSLLGGNADDSGIDADKPRQWWANAEELDANKRYRSELQYLLNTVPLTPNNLGRFQDAAALDLEWMLSSGLASSVTVSATMPALNTVKIQPRIEIQGVEFAPAFTYRRDQ